MTYEEEQWEETPPPIPPPIQSETRAIDPVNSFQSQAHGYDTIDLELKEKLPKKEALGELLKFKGLEDPTNH